MDYTYITRRLAIGDVESRASSDFGAVVSVITTTDRPCILYVELPAGKGPQVPTSVPVHHIDIADGESWAMGPDCRRLESYLTEATNFMAHHLGGGSVNPRYGSVDKLLVHCGRGQSRSVAVVMAYLCRFAGMAPDDALAFIQARRPSADPCPPMVLAVKQWLAAMRWTF